MASCRCTEIKECESKISTLTKTSIPLIAVGNRIKSMDEQLGNLASTYPKGFESEKNAELCNDTETLSSDIKSVKGEIGGKIAKKLAELTMQLLKLKAEDEEYHEEERRKEEQKNDCQYVC